MTASQDSSQERQRSRAKAPRSGAARGKATPSAGRVILVSNRLPISVRSEHGRLVFEESSGGLATGLRGFHSVTGSVWVGWPGETWKLRADHRAELRRRLAERQIVPVELTRREVARYYDGFANGVLWPLLHYQLDRLPLTTADWATYEKVNRRFADAAVEQYRPGDVIWVHDYQLMLVPAMIRERLPDAPIGFFLHVPFPSAEVFRLLPWRRQLLEGMLGATLIGFHTVSYGLHFLTSAANVLAAETQHSHVILEGRSIRVGTFPMGIDFESYQALAAEPGVEREARLLRESGAVDGKLPDLIVSVDRLDYTKGLLRRLLAFERLLEKYPRLRRRVRLIQVAAPSRVGVAEYQEFSHDVNEIVGRINGRFAFRGHDPIHYISRNLTSRELAPIYRAASVALVTPLRDGMNLVAKEFVACRVDGDGVLVLSELAGAANELVDALIVNPYDIDAVAEALHTALLLPESERRARMADLRERVASYDANRWARSFIGSLRVESRRQIARALTPGPAVDCPEDVLEAFLGDPERPLLLLLDYDGTLVGLRPTPGEASPDAEILRILANLALLPGVEVHVVSGRRREDLELWLGALPIGIHSEHGLWSRDAHRNTWTRREVRTAWYEPVEEIMKAWTARVPGSLVEPKEATISFHFRKSPIELARREAALLYRRLQTFLQGSTGAVLSGRRVVEVRDAETNKGLIVRDLAVSRRGARMLIVGDDVSDEDMFRAAPADAITVRVGTARTQTAARMRLVGPDQVRKLVALLADQLGARVRPGHDVELPNAGAQVAVGADAEMAAGADTEMAAGTADRPDARAHDTPDSRPGREPRSQPSRGSED